MINYLEDKDLEFLKNCPNEDLKALADLLVFNEKGKKRWNEKLSQKKTYMENYPNNLRNAVDDIILELQCYGAHTVASAAREIFGKNPGVSYKEILMDICKKKKINFNDNSSTERIEYHLIQNIIEEVLLNASDEDILAIAKEFGLSITGTESRERIIDDILEKSTSPDFYYIITNIVDTAVRIGPDSKDVIVVGAGVGVAQGAKYLIKAALPRFVGLASPGINVLMWTWLISDVINIVGGPAFRITVPAVILIINLRQKMKKCLE